MSPRRSKRPFEAILIARMSDSDPNAPETRSASFSSPVCRMTAGLTAFCARSAAIKVAAIDAQPGQFLGGELDEDLLVLGTHDLDLGHVRHAQQPRADLLHMVPQLVVRESVRGEAVDDAEGVAELVVEARADYASRQGVADSARGEAPECLRSRRSRPERARPKWRRSRDRYEPPPHFVTTRSDFSDRRPRPRACGRTRSERTRESR